MLTWFLFIFFQCYETPLPPYRRPPTPGPPPAYDSVVSQADQFRRFGKDEDCSEELDKIHRYCSEETTTYLKDDLVDSRNSLDKLRHCRVEGCCSYYHKTDGEVNTDSNGSFSSSEEVYDVSRKHFDQHHTTIGQTEQMTSFCSVVSNDHVIVEIDSGYLDVDGRDQILDVGKQVQDGLAEYEVTQITTSFGEVKETVIIIVLLLNLT